VRLPKTREYPDSVIIKDEIWSIRFCRSVPDEEPSTVGLCDPSEKTLWIKLGQGRYETFRTFIHEVTHAIEDEYDFTLRHEHVEKIELGFAAFIVINF